MNFAIQMMNFAFSKARDWDDAKERFVNLRARYINKLDAEATGRALAKRTFDTSWMGALPPPPPPPPPSSLDPTGWVALRPVSGAAATVLFLRQVW